MINAYRLAQSTSKFKMMGEIAVFGEAQVGKTCFIDMVGECVFSCLSMLTS
jgi:hypothetical protein